MPAQVGREAEAQLPRQRALCRPAEWGTGSRAHKALAALMLHFPSYEMKDAPDELLEAWLKTYAVALADVPLDVLEDACTTALSALPPFRKMPTPAELLELMGKRRTYWLRKNRLLILETLAKAKRYEEKPQKAATDEELQDITELMDKHFKRGKYAVQDRPEGEETAP